MHSILFTLFLQAAIAYGQAMPDAEIRKLLVDRIDQRKEGVGIVVGVIDGDGRRVVAYGRMGVKDERPVDADTIYEIGSITKVFTSLLLSDMVLKKEVSLDDTVAKFLPENVKTPENGAGQITLRDLASHYSGLPRLPDNLKPKNMNDPYADYDAERLYEFLRKHELKRKPGEKSEYSNLGAGLLGHLLTLRTGKSYEALMRARICEPLKMPSTWVNVPAAMEKRFATGHNGTLSPVAHWGLDALAGAGAIRSSTNDMLQFLAAAMGNTKTPLAPAFEAMVASRRSVVSGVEIGLAWHINTRDDTEVIWHNGGTGGFRTFTGFNPKTHIGVVVMSNVSTPVGVDDIGMHLLNPKSPLSKPPAVHKEVSINPKILDGYVGKYEIAPTFAITITKEGDNLFLQATGQPKFQVFPEAEREFFLKVVDAQITFEVDAEGKATKLVLHQNGQNLPGKRVE